MLKDVLTNEFLARLDIMDLAVKKRLTAAIGAGSIRREMI